jgi:diguanylate cyclase (GGDEF)-like protein/PAS domain S-box-containing protein
MKMDAAYSINHNGKWLAWLVLLLGFMVAGVAYWQSQVLIDRELATQLDLRAKEAKYSIEREVDRYAEVLHGLQAQFVANPDLSRRTFQQVARSLRLDHRLPGIQAIAFTQRVAPGAAPAFEASMRRELATDNVGYPPPVIQPRTPSGEAFVVQYHEPIEKNQTASWFNQASEPKRRAAIEQARDTGEWSSSGRIRLAVAPDFYNGIIFFLPVYRGGVIPATLDARRRQFVGVVFLVIRVDEMLRNVFGPRLLDDMDIEIYDMQDASPSSKAHGMHNLIFDSGRYHQTTKLHSGNTVFPLQRKMELHVGGSLWHVDVAALPVFVKRSQHWLPSIVALMGVMLSLFLFYFLRALELSRQTLRTHACAVEATAHLRERAMEACANAIIITSAKAPEYPIEYVNSAFERMTGYTADEVIGHSLRILHRDDREQPGLGEIRSLLNEQREGHATMRNYRKDGTPYWSDVYIAPVRDDSGLVTHFVAAKYDVTATKKYEAELEFQANRDTLTGLANRNLLRDRLTQAIAYADCYAHPVWVVFVDLDRFKFVVDTLGLTAGDLLLKKIADRLQSVVREADTVARMAGDDFVLVLPERSDENLSMAILQRIIDAVAQPLIIDGHEFFPSCSVGVAAYPTDDCDADTLIKYAGIAVYRARETGRNHFQFYTPTMNEHALERLRIESDLRNAIEREEFVLHYQPQVDLRTSHIVGMEALIRWQHPELGMISPGRFIGLAEETGMIVPIGAWVLRTACMQNKAWQLAGLGYLRVAVNLSVRQFAQPDLVQSIAQILEESGLEPHYLDIELTESVVMADVEQAVGILRSLKKLGVHLSIDDFGTGYSSLSYLKRFPIDVLKIDQSFVRDITTNPDDAAIARSVVSMAHSLRLQVIAEGVETEAQLAYLRRHACDQMQGYYFSRPVPADAFEQMLQERKCLPLETGRAAAPRQTLLIVDDEANVTAALDRLLRQDGYHILKADTAAEAFELLALHPVQVIICDHRMPVMSGSEFLSKVKELHPDPIRIMLSGYTELESVLDAINRGAIYRFFTKPWNDEVLRDNIRKAFLHYWLLHSAVPAANVGRENDDIDELLA